MSRSVVFRSVVLNPLLRRLYNPASCVFPQLPCDPVHREPLQRPPAEEDGPVPGGGPGGQTGRVQHQGGRVGTAAVSRAAQGKDPGEGELRVLMRRGLIRSGPVQIRTVAERVLGRSVSALHFILCSWNLRDFKGR